MTALSLFPTELEKWFLGCEVIVVGKRFLKGLRVERMMQNNNSMTLIGLKNNLSDDNHERGELGDSDRQ